MSPVPRKHLPLALLLVLGALLFHVANAGAAEPGVYKYTGTVAGCPYSLKLDSNDKAIEAASTECVGGALAVELEGSYEGEDVILGTVKATGTIAGEPVDLEETLGVSFPLGEDLEALVGQIEHGANKSIAQAAVDRAVHDAMWRMQGLALSELVPEGVGDPNGVLNEVTAAENSLCRAADGKSQVHVSDNCDPPDCPKAPGVCDEPTGKVGSVSGDEEDGTADTTNLCPVVNEVQDEVVYVCVPSLVPGDLDTKSKPIVILPGGALIVLPLDSSGRLDLSAGPTLESEDAILSFGGLIVGFNLTLKAPEIALAAGRGDQVGALDLEAEEIDLGHVDIGNTLDTLGLVEHRDLEEWKGAAKTVQALGIGNEALSEGTFTAPVTLEAASVEAEPEESFTLGAGSRLDTSGRGHLGGLGGGDGEAGGGAKDLYGGSHGGYGGYPGGHEYELGIRREQQGRGDTYDSPFAPTAPGNGGSGTEEAGFIGAPGGGTVRIDGTEADAVIDGTIEADGANTGESGFGAIEGGAGAGGSIYVTAESLSGSGAVGADGGGYPGGASNGFGGEGGGGRVALISEEDEWEGSAHAYGGVDEERTVASQPVLASGTGGAGTVFTQTVEFESDGTIKEGTGDFPEGTLTVAGGRPATYFPPPDGTPVLNEWSDPERKLVVAGGARAYGEKLDFGEIDLKTGGVLTGDYAVEKLEVESEGLLSVDAQSRIDMLGFGAAGGTGWTGTNNNALAGAGGTAPGQTPSARGFGGSHGGAGGAVQVPLTPEGRAGSTYDDPEQPALVGGGGAAYEDHEGSPGGGVLDVTAGRLVLNGVLDADGEDGEGPTVNDPEAFEYNGGAGAGGSVLVEADTISGAGTVRADGGWTCLEEGDGRWLDVGLGNACGLTYAGGGGGGRVAIHSTACGWTGTMAAAGGINEMASHDEASARSTDGAAGTARFISGTAECPPPEEEKPSAGGETGGGGNNSSGGGGGNDSAPPPAAPTRHATIPITRLLHHPSPRLELKNAQKLKVSFKFSSPTPGATFECKLDKAAFKRCTSPATFKVSAGSHLFEVRAKGAAGADASPAAFKFKVVALKNGPGQRK